MTEAPNTPPQTRNAVVVESPYAGDITRNVKYARACVLDCLKNGEAPIASHLLYTQEGILDDNKPGDRSLGIHAGLEWIRRADFVAVYVDYGVTPGMREAIEYADRMDITVELRTLPAADFKRLDPDSILPF